MKINKKALAEALSALSDYMPHEGACDGGGHEHKPELVKHEGGYIVEVHCSKCTSLLMVAHPKAALEIAGPDSELGQQILSVFPEWKVPVQ